VALLIADCPRCGAKEITFDVLSFVYLRKQYNWQDWYEVFSKCRNCRRSTTFVIAMSVDGKNNYRREHEKFEQDQEYILKYGGSLNNFFRIEEYISSKDRQQFTQPEFTPDDIGAAFREGAMCYAVGCYNASAAMFRLCLDLATQPLLPAADCGEPNLPNPRQRRDLGSRLPWLFETGRLPQAMADLASCIRESGNDGAHRGNLSKEDADDILDFTLALLERLFTEPEKLRRAHTRRDARRLGRESPDALK
jgi:hypothetical protein